MVGSVEWNQRRIPVALITMQIDRWFCVGVKLGISQCGRNSLRVFEGKVLRKIF
jgi:hypothetical protein